MLGAADACVGQYPYFWYENQVMSWGMRGFGELRNVGEDYSMGEKVRGCGRAEGSEEADFGKQRDRSGSWRGCA